MQDKDQSGGGLVAMSAKPLAFFIKLAGLTEVVDRVKAVLQVLSSSVDALAVYVLMAALTTTVDLEMQGKAWFQTLGQ